MKTDQQKIGSLISQLRQQKGMTQQEFADALKTSQSAVARIEKGEQNVSTALIAKMSHILKRDIINLGNRGINLKIDGGKKLSGSIQTNTSKNAAVALLCASLLNKGQTTLKNVPKIEEVKRISEVLASIGVSVKRNGNDIIITPPKKIDIEKLNEDAARKTRSIIMFVGPLIHEFTHFSLPNAGGCKLGARTVRPHFFALEEFGVQFKKQSDHYEVYHNALHGNEVVLYETGDTVTENAIMAAARIPEKTVIKFASANYMVQDLCFFLEKLGVQIEGIGTTTLTIHGKKEIDVDVEYHLSEDPIESMLFLAIAAATNSEITITRCPIDFLELELYKLKKMGFSYERSDTYKALNGKTNLVDITTKPSSLTAADDKIHPLPYPGINMDNLPFFIPICSIAEGTTLIHDWVYENRAIYYTELNKLGANITLVDPHRVFVKGKSEFHAGEIVCPPALRPAAIILIAMLAAPGVSVLRNIYSIKRGYEDIAERLNSIGAQIEMFTDL